MSGHYAEIWGVHSWLRRALEYRVYFASLISFSHFWLVEFLHKISIQKFFADVIDGPCTHMAWVYHAQMPPRVPNRKTSTGGCSFAVHTRWNHLPFVSFCAFNIFLSLCLWNLHIYRVQNILPIAFTSAFVAVLQRWYLYACCMDKGIEAQTGSVSCSWCLASVQIFRSLKPKRLFNSATNLLSKM